MLLGKLVIQGHSMEPLFKTKDLVLVSSLPYLFKSPEVSDIVAFILKDKIMIKRIVKIEGSKIYVEGDNRKDSLKVGKIVRKQILGKIIYKI
jgi:signal peptidase I